MPQLWLNDAIDLLTAPYTAEVGTEFGDWQAITTAVDSLFLDGSVVSGEATGNRTVRLQVSVAASPRWALVEACEALFVEANKPASTLRFVPDEGDAEVYDLFRAQPERTDDQSEAWTRRQYTLTFPALPFVRSGVRQTPAALAPARVLDGFEATTGGFGLADMPPVGYSISYSGGSAPTTWAIPIADAAAAPLAAVVARGAVEAVSNCTLTDGSVQRSTKATATQAGMMEVCSTATWATSDDVVTAAVKAIRGAHALSCIVGVEWLDAGGASLSTDWGPDRTVSLTGSGTAPGSWPDVWSASARPAAATQCRLRLRAVATVAGDVLDVSYLSAWPSASVPPTPSPGTGIGGSGSLRFVPDGRVATTPGMAFAGYVRRALPAAVNISEVPYAMVAAQVLASGTTGTAAAYAPGGPRAVSVRLFNAAGDWARYDLAGSTFANTWSSIRADLSTPASTSLGAVLDDVLSAVAAYDIAVLGTGVGGDLWDLDLLAAEPLFSGTSTRQGSVLSLDDIKGAARSPVRVTISGKTPMTDWLVAAADMAVPPMLAVSANVATAAAPAPYDGVYRVIGALAPASAETNPTCTVAQLIDGVQVASQVLDGTLQAGNHYVDFGVCPLPMVGVPTDNEAVSYTFTLSPADTDWSEVLVLDMARPVAWLPNIATPMAYGWIDEPEPTAQMGRVWVGSTADRSDARSPADPPDLSLPFSVRAPGVQLLVYSTSGAPDVSLSYDPRRLS